jgi:hypothetical protein
MEGTDVVVQEEAVLGGTVRSEHLRRLRRLQ